MKEIFTIIYADYSDKMLYGHAYSRAVLAHILTNLVLAGIILNEADFTAEEKAETENIATKLFLVRVKYRFMINIDYLFF